MKARGLVGLVLMLGSLTGCASATSPDTGMRYGLGGAEALSAFQRGEGREALAHYERAAVDLEREGKSVDAAKAYHGIAVITYRHGQYQKAIHSSLRALELLKAEPETRPLVGTKVSLYTLVAHGYRQVGDLGEARRFFEEGLELIRPWHGHPGSVNWSANLRRGLASVAFAQQDYSAAIQSGEAAIASLRDLFRRARISQARESAGRNLAWTLMLVGRAQTRLRTLDKAEASLRQALEIAKEIGLREGEAEAVANLAAVALARKDYSHALEQYQQALDIATRLDQATLLIALHRGIGQTFSAQGRHEEALAAYRRSLVLVEDLRSQLQEASLRSGFLEDKQAIYHGAVRSALALGKPEEAFAYAERGRARAFLDLLGNQTTLSKGRSRILVEEEARLRARLSEARTSGDDALGEGKAAQAREQLESAERAYRAFLDRVKRENLEQASLMTVEPVALQEVQKLLPEGTTLLEFLVTEQESLVWVIDRARVEVVRLPLTRKQLVNQVRAFRGAIARQDPLEQVQGRAARLYEGLVTAARPHIRGDRLLIIPHDVLHYLPFGALRSPEGRWLVEDYTFSTLPSASVLKYLPDKGEGASKQVLALGNPDLGPALALRYGEREARAVGEHYPGATVLVRQVATEAKVKALSNSMGLLHFATHAELDEQDPLSSALLLVPEGTEDGRLEVREIFGLDLKARLVVLSACETGLGKLSRGDELVGLQRAFIYAGTPGVVTSLWKVDDQTSFLLMREFYDLLKTQGPAAALRQAQSRVMREFPHPFAWAAFGLTGLPR